MAKVRLENVTKKMGALCPVYDLTLEVKDKEFVTLLAPSGSGKTTVLRLIAGLETPEAGNIYIGDDLVNELSPAERDIAFVFQTYALYPNLNVYENLASPLRARNTPENEIKKSVQEVAETLHISHLLNKKPTQLSGGEMQRVAIGRAIIRRPRVYLFDEPLTNLDAKLRVHMRAELKRLQKDLGQTTIYVTHDEVEAMSMSDRIAVLRYGVMQQYGTPEEIYNHPKNLFVAYFVGTPPINLFDCTFIETDGKAILETEAFSLNVTDLADIIKKQASSSEVILGARPSDISISKKRRDQDSIPAEVYVSEPMGAITIVDLKVGDKLVKVKVPGVYQASMGEKVWLTFNKDRIHIFDKRSGGLIL